MCDTTCRYISNHSSPWLSVLRCLSQELKNWTYTKWKSSHLCVAKKGMSYFHASFSDHIWNSLKCHCVISHYSFRFVSVCVYLQTIKINIRIHIYKWKMKWYDRSVRIWRNLYVRRETSQRLGSVMVFDGLVHFLLEDARDIVLSWMSTGWFRTESTKYKWI